MHPDQFDEAVSLSRTHRWGHYMWFELRMRFDVLEFIWVDAHFCMCKRSNTELVAHGTLAFVVVNSGGRSSLIGSAPLSNAVSL